METSNSDLEKVIAKIQKCFALSRGTHSEAEADTAARTAQELMLKYNLDMATVEAADGKRAAANGPVERIKEQMAGKTRFKWQRDLAKSVAEANFCYYMLKETSEYDEAKDKYRTVKSHVFVGRKGNVTTAQMMYAYLTQTIEDNAPTEDSRIVIGATYLAEYHGSYYRCTALNDGTFQSRGENFKTLTAAAKAITGRETNGFIFWGLGAASTAESWKQGCSDRIGQRLDAKRAEMIREHDEAAKAARGAGARYGESTAIILASEYDASEREANEEIAHGLPIGYYAKRRAEAAERDRRWAAERAACATEITVAPEAEVVVPETDAQRKRREREERAEAERSRRYWDRQDAKQARAEAKAAARIDRSAYRAGAEAGKHVGLDPQVNATNSNKKIGS